MPAGTVPRPDGSFTLGKPSVSSPFDVDSRSAVKASPFDVGKAPGGGGPPPHGVGLSPLAPQAAPRVAPPHHLVPADARLPAAAPPGRVELNVHTERTQYFVITSNTKENVVKSVRHSLWATQKKNEQKLDEAFRTAPFVVLIFSVNGSEAFQGYARMRSPIGQPRARGVDPFHGFGRLFDIEWLRLHDLHYREVESLRNPLNGDRPVRQCRDGQALTNHVGRALCELIDRHIDDPESFAPPERPRPPPQQALPGLAPPDPGRSPYALGAPGYTNGAPGSAYSALGAASAAAPTQFGGMLALPAPGGSKQPRRSSSSGSGDEDNQRRKKKRKKDRKYRHAPHPLLAGFEEHLDFFLSLDYDDYIQWFKRHGSVAPGPTAPPGTEAPDSQHLQQQPHQQPQLLPGAPPPHLAAAKGPPPHLAGMLSGAPMHSPPVTGPMPHSMPPWAGAMPHGPPLHGYPPHGPPPHGLPPHGLPPHGMPPHGMPPHGLPARMV